MYKMNIGKYLNVAIDEMFIHYELVDANGREWMNGKERKSFDLDQCLQQLTQLIKHKNEHYGLTEVKLQQIDVELDQERFKSILQKQVRVKIN